MLIEIPDIENVFHIPEPWYIDRCQFDEKMKRMAVYLKFRRKLCLLVQDAGKKRNRYKILLTMTK